MQIEFSKCTNCYFYKTCYFSKTIVLLPPSMINPNIFFRVEEAQTLEQNISRTDRLICPKSHSITEPTIDYIGLEFEADLLMSSRDIWFFNSKNILEITNMWQINKDNYRFLPEITIF